MSLTKYKKKRNFKNTNEPKPEKSPKTDQLMFVVQKHNASRLHYDFRLEAGGVLKSWAVPKGPSLDPEVKRLAMMVEDHPYDYGDFEGIIPKGNYGAGEVIVWDTGIYAPIGSERGNSKKENEKLITAGIKKGDLKFVLLGKKLKGEFALVKMKNDENSWLLIKKKDEYSSSADILEKDRSAISTLTIKKLKKENEAAGK
jgi:bifunctional non-homologous end joining protein LigD